MSGVEPSDGGQQHLNGGPLSDNFPEGPNGINDIDDEGGIPVSQEVLQMQ